MSSPQPQLDRVARLKGNLGQSRAISGDLSHSSVLSGCSRVPSGDLGGDLEGDLGVISGDLGVVSGWSRGDLGVISGWSRGDLGRSRPISAEPRASSAGGATPAAAAALAAMAANFAWSALAPPSDAACTAALRLPPPFTRSGVHIVSTNAIDSQYDSECGPRAARNAQMLVM